MRLSQAALGELRGIRLPDYDRHQVSVGMVHFGVGGFHRAHQAVYVDDVLAAGSTEWGICGVGTQPADRQMRDVMLAQDCLYTVTEKAADGSAEHRVVGSLLEYLYAPDDPEAVIERLAAPETRIVSLTITEGGWPVDPSSRTFAPVDPALLLDAEPGAVPATAIGLITSGLTRRRERGLLPFTVLSCDNIAGNGDVARAAFSGYAGLVDPELGEWVRISVSFPNAMVDRITPTTTAADRDRLLADTGIEDAWPVVCEPFTQWVMEADFPLGRPAWEVAGVQVVPDVHPYELMKLRLLNAGHQAIGYLGYLAGYRTTDEVCADEAFAQFLLDYMTWEATPTLPPVPGVDLAEYRATLLARFRNPAVRDTLERLCAWSSDRIPTFLLPVARHQLATGGDVRRCATVVAGWARYAEGVDESGEPIYVVDRLLETVQAAAARSAQEPTAFLTDTGLFGELARHPDFVAAYTDALQSLRERGARATVAALAEPG